MSAAENVEDRVPLFTANIVLAIPTIMLLPGLDEIQQCVNKAIQIILKMAEDIPIWEQTIINQKAVLKVSFYLSYLSKGKILPQ